MNRMRDKLCLLDPGRSRVISGHSRDIGHLIIVNIWNIGIRRKRKEKNWETGRGEVSPVCVS